MQSGTTLRAAGLAAALSGWLILGASDASAILIDGFDAPQTLQASSGTPTSGGVTVSSSILGGERDEIVNWSAGASPVDLVIDAGGNDRASISTGLGTFGSVGLYWDGVDGTPFGAVNLGLGLDLTSATALAVDVVSNGFGASLQFNLFSGATAVSSVVVNLPILLSPTTILFPLASLVQTGATPVDLANVGAIELTINPTAGNGPLLSIDAVRAVPEPDAALLWAGVALALGLARRR